MLSGQTEALKPGTQETRKTRAGEGAMERGLRGRGARGEAADILVSLSSFHGRRFACRCPPPTPDGPGPRPDAEAVPTHRGAAGEPRPPGLPPPPPHRTCTGRAHAQPTGLVTSRG